MVLQPSNNALQVGSLSIGTQAQSAPKNINVSSYELATSSFNPSVNVDLSSTKVTVANIPPIYSKPTVYAINESQLQSSRVSVSSAALAENAILSKPSDTSSDVSQTENSPEEQEENKSIGKQENETISSAFELSDEELEIIERLKTGDSEVRAHEQAHKAVGGQYTGAISYSYQAGPDGKRYAVGGEVPIDVSPIPGDPQATITKMTVVSAAATAPANPSAQDRTVAAEASRLLSEAQAELATDRAEARVELREKQQKSSDERKENMEKADKLNAYTEGLLGVIEEISQMGEETQALLDAIA